jgi:hypothetical protein
MTIRFGLTLTLQKTQQKIFASFMNTKKIHFVFNMNSCANLPGVNKGLNLNKI